MERIKVLSVTPLSNMRLLVVFTNQVVKIFDVRQIISDFPEYATLENEDLFSLVEVEIGGYGISWTSELDASEGELWDNGVELPLSVEDLVLFIRHNILITAEVTDLLDCSRQNIEDLVKRKKLEPIKSFPKGKIFLKSDIVQRINPSFDTSHTYWH